MHPSGRWVVGSNRGDDSLVVFSIAASTGKLTLAGFTKAGGTMPLQRFRAFDPTGTWLYAADQGSSLLVPFRFDADQGSLTAIPGGALTVSNVSYVGLGPL